MRAGTCGVFVTVALLALGSASPAHAEALLAQARQAVDGSDYATARTLLVTALAAGTASPEELAEIYRLTGIVNGALGDAAAATDAFKRLLALQPKTTLPPGTSPKIARPFAAAATYWTTHEPLGAKAETRAEPPSVALEVTSDPLAMIARIRVTFIVDDGTEQTREGPASVALPRGARIDLRVAVLDARGNRLLELGSKDVPIVIVGARDATRVTVAPKPPVGATPAPRPAEPSRPIYLAWWLHAGVAVAALGAATYFGLEARAGANELAALQANSANHTYPEALAVEDRARRDVLVANLGFGAAGAFAIAAGILFLTRPDSREPTSLAVRPSPLRHGGAVTLEVAF